MKKRREKEKKVDNPKAHKELIVWVIVIVIILIIGSGSYILSNSNSQRKHDPNLGKNLNATDNLSMINISMGEGEGGGGEGMGGGGNWTNYTEDNPCVLNFNCPQGTSFVGTKSSKKFHYCDCDIPLSSARSNIVCFDDALEAQMQDYWPCPVCKPPSIT